MQGREVEARSLGAAIVDHEDGQPLLAHLGDHRIGHPVVIIAWDDGAAFHAASVVWRVPWAQRSSPWV